MPFATLRDDYTDRHGCRSVALCLPGTRDLITLGAALATTVAGISSTISRLLKNCGLDAG